MHPLLYPVLMGLGVIASLTAAALSIALQSWLPYVSLLGVVSLIGWFKFRERKTFDSSISDERRERAFEEYVREVKKD